MSEVRLVVREADCDWSGTIHASCADRAVAALSADPVTRDELEIAMERFVKRSRKDRLLGNLSRSDCAEPYDAGLVVIDLVARLVVVDSTYSSPGHQGVVEYHNGRYATDKRLRYHLANDWVFSSDGENWLHLAEKRRQQRTAKPARNDREVFYGRPLLEFLARECFAAFARRDEIAAAVRAELVENARKRLAKRDNIAPEQVDVSKLTDEEVTPRSWLGSERCASPYYDTLKGIHAAWLLTPRDDLGSAWPREIALERHDHLSHDMDDRCQQWSLLGECPRGLDITAHAFRHGGFGTHELVQYYYLMRALLWSCWERLNDLAQASNVSHRPESLTVGDFLTTEVPRLDNVREIWLDTPDRELHGRTPRSVIERERARLPEGACGHEAVVDPDCPCCQMIGEMSGPMFWHLDGSSMDDEFAFDLYHQTREEWDEERRKWDEYSRRCAAERSESDCPEIAGSTSLGDIAAPEWSSGLSTAEICEIPLTIRMFNLGCQLGNLVVGLRAGADRENTSSEARRLIDQLNRDFGNLRELVQRDDSSLAEALIDPVLHRFGETLETIAASRPDLSPQSERVRSILETLLGPPHTGPGWNSDNPVSPY